MIIKNIIFDVDGVFTDGTFYYSSEGKVMKKFGSHDAQALRICRPHFNIYVISADERGLAITKRRFKDLNLDVELVSEIERKNWIKNNFIREESAFVADSFTDIASMSFVARTFAPAGSHQEFRNRATDKLKNYGGNGAVAEVLNILIYEKLSKNLWELN
jgi:YrbI family 3-deoxy-D-manno-octulosonate 8-phosphate phosphatase